MKKIFTLFLFLFCLDSFARLQSVEITGSAGAPIPNSYSLADPQSATMTVEGIRHCMGWNLTDEIMRVHIVRITVDPSDSVTDFVWLPAGGYAAWDFLPVADNSIVFLRSNGSPVTNDKKVLITCW